MARKWFLCSHGDTTRTPKITSDGRLARPLLGVHLYEVDRFSNAAIIPICGDITIARLPEQPEIEVGLLLTCARCLAQTEIL